MNKQLFLALILGIVLSAALQAQVPSWYLDREADYPSAFYIAAVGEGPSRSAAETAAVAAVSLFFNTSTEIRNEAIREFNEAVTGNATDFSKKTYISENAVIRSEEEFLGVRFADPFNDRQRGIWAALAYIDRREAARIYRAKIEANMAALKALVADAAGEKELLYVCGLLNKAVRIGDITEEYVKTASVVDSGQRAGYASDLAAIQEARSAYRSKRGGLSFTVALDGPANAVRVERKIQQLLEGRGYVVTARNPLYTVQARLSGEEGGGDGGYYVRPGIDIRIERDGTTLFSYAKTYDRFTNLSSVSGAYTRAFREIEKDLEERFITQFAAMIGG
jgi:hypothetical protein